MSSVVLVIRILMVSGKGCNIRGSNSFKLFFASLFEKGAILKGKNKLPFGTHSFLLEQVPFQEAPVVHESNHEATKFFSPVSLLYN